jgi:hypothetical protein
VAIVLYLHRLSRALLLILLLGQWTDTDDAINRGLVGLMVMVSSLVTRHRAPFIEEGEGVASLPLPYFFFFGLSACPVYEVFPPQLKQKISFNSCCV